MIHRRPHKYGAKPATDMSGTRRFQSQLERDRYEELHLLELAGQIRGLVCQPRVWLLPTVAYKCDFTYEEPESSPDGWRPVWEEVKGFESERYQLLAKLWNYFGPGVLRVVKRASKRAGFAVTREIVPTAPPCAACGAPWLAHAWRRR